MPVCNTLVTHCRITRVERRKVELAVAWTEVLGWWQHLKFLVLNVRWFWVISSPGPGRVPGLESLGARVHTLARVSWRDHFF